ncbi:hypothetical protein AB0K51_18205 [Kitasatospora sp. NPDC049285]
MNHTGGSVGGAVFVIAAAYNLLARRGPSTIPEGAGPLTERRGEGRAA